MNSFGRLFRISIFGESHGESIGILVDGCPPGIDLSIADFSHDLERRKSGLRGTTSRNESDRPLIKSGVFENKTTGAPITVIFHNQDVDSSSYEKMKNTPRPGHADFVAYKKFKGFNDYRGGGHFSGRLTACLVAAGVIAKKIISDSSVQASVIEVCGTTETDRAIDEALKEGDSVGGIVECKVSGLPVGLGEPFFDSVESLISHAVFSIPAVKGIEFGAGFKSALMKGSSHNDEILDETGITATNYSGGINGGITNGNDLVFRVAVKPTSSIKKNKKTFDLLTKQTVDISVEGRHDACIALRIPPVLEAITACVLADLKLLAYR